MNRFLLLVCLLYLSVPLFAQERGRTELNLPDPPMLGAHFARAAKAQGGPFKSPNLTYHGGPVLTGTTSVKAIFWGAQWDSASFVGDKITGLTAWYSGVGGSAYAGTNTEYTNSSGTHVSPFVSYLSSVIDTRPAPPRAPSTSTILNEVCSMIGSPDPNGYYPVYVDTPRGGANYCAWHSWGSCPTSSGNVPVQFAFFFNLDGDPGCDPQDSSSTHSQGLEALVNVTGHELSEALTDPRGNAWYDNSGSENSDKCAWSFGSPVSLGGSQWKIQGNWSNAAYADRSGFGNSQGQKGCIDGN